MKMSNKLFILLGLQGVLAASWQRWLPQRLEEYFPDRLVSVDDVLELSPNDPRKKLEWTRHMLQDSPAKGYPLGTGDLLEEYLQRWGRTQMNPLAYVHLYDKKLSLPGNDIWRDYNYEGPSFAELWYPYDRNRDDVLNSFADWGAGDSSQPQRLTDQDVVDRLTEQQRYRGPFWHGYHSPSNIGEAFAADQPRMKDFAARMWGLRDAAYRYYLDQQAHKSHDDWTQRDATYREHLDEQARQSHGEWERRPMNRFKRWLGW